LPCIVNELHNVADFVEYVYLWMLLYFEEHAFQV